MEFLILAVRPAWAPFALIALVLAGMAGAYFGWVNLQQAKALGTLVRPSLSGSGGGGSLGPAPRIGLLYSVNTPEEQAARESIKGWALLVGAPALCAGLGAYLMLM